MPPIAPTIAAAPGQDLPAYARSLVARFANPALGHRLIQIAMDGSQKIPQRWLETLAVQQGRGISCPAILTGLAAWLGHVRGDNGPVWGPVDDPLAGPLAEAWAQAGEAGIVAALFGAGGRFADHWQAGPDDTARITALIAAPPA